LSGSAPQDPDFVVNPNGQVNAAAIVLGILFAAAVIAFAVVLVLFLKAKGKF
jgi:hypothetical protein